MPRSVSDTLKVAVNAPETDEVFILLLTLTHDSLEEPIRVCDNGLGDLPIAGVWGTESRGDEFVQMPFEFTLPGEGENQSPFSRIRIDNVSREITKAVRSISSAPEVKAEVVLASDPDTVEISLEGFNLINVTYDQLVVEGTLSVEQFEDEPYPGDRYMPSITPGVF
ncbi:MAG: DUF1833 family protein [Micavibrio sp.]